MLDTTLEPRTLGRPKSPEPGIAMSIRIPIRLREILVILAQTNRRNISNQITVVLEAGLKAMGVTEPRDEEDECK